MSNFKSTVEADAAKAAKDFKAAVAAAEVEAENAPIVALTIFLAGALVGQLAALIFHI